LEISELAEIEDIQTVHNKWWFGIGISHVSGLVAVALRLRSGDNHRIGTDDVEGFPPL
jgi:hypothetical protein